MIEPGVSGEHQHTEECAAQGHSPFSGTEPERQEFLREQSEQRQQDPYSDVDFLANDVWPWLKRHPTQFVNLMQAVIALGLLAVTFSQLVLSWSTSKQTDQLITAANNIQLSANQFSRDAAGINQGVSDAVNRLNAQAQATAELAKAGGKQASAAEQQAKTSAAQLNISERPWIKVALALIQEPGRNTSVYLDDLGRLHISVVVQAWNIGRYPATKVQGEVSIVPSVGLIADTTQRRSIELAQHKLCDEMDKAPSANASLIEGATVFPGDAPYQIPAEPLMLAETVKSELAKPSNNTFRMADGGTVMFMGDNTMLPGVPGAMGAIPDPGISVIGCLTYSVDYSAVTHHTFLLYEAQGINLRQVDSSHPSLQKNPIGETTQIDNPQVCRAKATGICNCNASSCEAALVVWPFRTPAA